jgi:hypothetical protein
MKSRPKRSLSTGGRTMNATHRFTHGDLISGRASHEAEVPGQWLRNNKSVVLIQDCIGLGLYTKHNSTTRYNPHNILTICTGQLRYQTNAKYCADLHNVHCQYMHRCRLHLISPTAPEVSSDTARNNGNRSIP